MLSRRPQRTADQLCARPNKGTLAMKLKTPQLPRKSHHQKGQNTAAPSPAPATPRSTTPPPATPLKKAVGGLATPTRGRNTAAMIAGLAFILVAAALAASVASSFDDSIQVLVASEPIAEGQPVTGDNFRPVRIAAGAGDIQAVSPDSLEDLIGLVAAGPIGEGSLVHPDQFVLSLEEEQIVIGAALSPNQYPADGVKPGDTVRLIAVSGNSRSEDGFTTGQEVAIGEITFVGELSNGLHVSVRVGESSANVIAQLVAQNRISLGLVDQSIRIDSVTPLIPAAPVTPLEIEAETAE